MAQTDRARRAMVLTLDARRSRVPILRVWLKRAARIEVQFTQVFPHCVGAGDFVVPGHRGLNVIPLRTRVDGRRLRPGAYHVDVRALGRQQPRRVKAVPLLVVGEKRPRAMLLSALQASNCGGNLDSSAAAALLSDGSLGLALASGSGSPVAGDKYMRSRRAGGVAGTIAGVAGAAIGSASLLAVQARALGTTLTAPVDDHPWLLPLLAGLILSAVALLGAAALPATILPSATAAAALAYRRLEFVLTGAALLAVAAFTYLAAALLL